MNFLDIPINKHEILQSDLNIDIKLRSNIFSWNGQFSPQFVEVILQRYSQDNFFILDPFLGSGTTVYEAIKCNLHACGVELNPSAYYMAKIYELSTLDVFEKKYIIRYIDKILEKLNSDNFITLLLNIIKDDKEYFVIKNLLSTLIILIDIYKNRESLEILHNKWKFLKDVIVTLPQSKNRISVKNSDARKISLNSSIADIILTSPPYINVFNYHQNYRKSVEALGFNVLKIAKSEFGSNRKHRGNRFLTVIQYCIDMALSLREAIRICKPNARMIYVIGRESLVLGYPFCNSELIYKIATEIFNIDFAMRQERFFKNRYGQIIYEDILHFINSKSTLLLINDEEIKVKARSIAVEMLFSRYSNLPVNKNTDMLMEAIKKSDKVNQSEIIL